MCTPFWLMLPPATATALLHSWFASHLDIHVLVLWRSAVVPGWCCWGTCCLTTTRCSPVCCPPKRFGSTSLVVGRAHQGPPSGHQPPLPESAPKCSRNKRPCTQAAGWRLQCPSTRRNCGAQTLTGTAVPQRPQELLQPQHLERRASLAGTAVARVNSRRKGLAFLATGVNTLLRNRFPCHSEAPMKVPRFLRAVSYHMSFTVVALGCCQHAPRAQMSLNNCCIVSKSYVTPQPCCSARLKVIPMPCQVPTKPQRWWFFAGKT
jgi:hypothetical protein